VDDAGSRFVVLFLADPHLLEGGQRGQDRSSDPDRVFSLRWGNDLNLHCGWGKGSQFLLHSVSNTGEHGRTTRQDDVSVQVLSDINITLHDGVVGGFVDSSGFHTQERGLEEGFRASESLISNGNDLTIGQFVGLLQSGGRGSSGHFLFKVQSNVGQLFLDVSDDFSFSSGGEGVSSFGQDLHQVVSQVTTSQVKSENGVGESITFIDGYSVGDTITTYMAGVLKVSNMI